MTGSYQTTHHGLVTAGPTSEDRYVLLGLRGIFEKVELLAKISELETFIYIKKTISGFS